MDGAHGFIPTQMARRVTLLPGDGVGPEVVAAARLVLDAAGAGVEWDEQPAGQSARERMGEPVPQAAEESIRACGVALKGPMTTGGHGPGPRSANLELRRRLGLFAAVRPARSLTGAAGAREGVDVVVIRMNQEDLYAGVGFERGSEGAARLAEAVREQGGPVLPPDAGLSLKFISESGAERVSRTAFAWAAANGRRRITVVHKATVMPPTDGLFLDAARRVAAEHPSLEVDDMLLDTACHELARHPERVDVLLAPVMYGDVLSDLAAGMVGGLGMTPCANFGDDTAIFETVHGSAPRLAGSGRANPMAQILAGAMLLRHIGEARAAARVETAVAEVVREARTLTYDIAAGSPPASTSEVAEAVAERVGS